MQPIELPSESVTRLPRALATRVKTLGFGIGIAGLAAASILGFLERDHYVRFSSAYLIAWLFFLSITLGALFFVTLQHLTRAGWSVVVRRLAECLASVVPVTAVLSLPILLPAALGNHSLFHWLDASAVAKDHLLHHKAPYLNLPFFLARCVFYFAAWIWMARTLLGRSLRQDEARDPAITLRSERAAAPMMFVYALTVTFAAIDFLMSLEPHWFSTIFGIYFFAGALVSFLAFLILVALWLQRCGILRQVIRVEHYHDLGKLLFGFNFFWAYIAFSQFMLIWYANIPEETFWYLTRQQGPWIAVALVLLFGHFVIPFVGLISRHAKRNLKVLAFFSAWLLVMHWIDLFYLAAPSISAHGAKDGAASFPLGLIELACVLGVGGVWVGSVARTLQDRPLVPIGDPRLGESLAFENV